MKVTQVIKSKTSHFKIKIFRNQRWLSVNEFLKNYPFKMEQSQLPEEVARLNEELDRVKAELKVEREKLTNQQQPDDRTPRVSKIKISD